MIFKIRALASETRASDLHLYSGGHSRLMRRLDLNPVKGCLDVPDARSLGGRRVAALDLGGFVDQVSKTNGVLHVHELFA